MSGTTPGGCTSHYAGVQDARTWAGLVAALEGPTPWGDVARVRVQARGRDVGAGDRRAVRVVDLLDARGHRLVQADVWRTPDDRGWHAGTWLQCID